MTSPNNTMHIVQENEHLTGLSAQDLAVARGGLLLFRPVSFSLAPRGAILIEGPNGIGKTTLLRTIAGLGPLAGGRLTPVGLIESRLGEHLHYLGHDNALRGQMSAGETALFWRNYQGGQGSVSEVFGILGLTGLEDIPAAYLSAGQKRKLALSRLLLTPRALWLLDEPLNALDTHSQAMMHRLIEQHRQGGGMVIAVSHGSLIMPGAQRIELDDRMEGRA